MPTISRRPTATLQKNTLRENRTVQCSPSGRSRNRRILTGFQTITGPIQHSAVITFIAPDTGQSPCRHSLRAGGAAVLFHAPPVLALPLIRKMTTLLGIVLPTPPLRADGCWLLPCPRRVCQCPSPFGARPLGHFLESGLLLPPLAALRRFPRLPLTNVRFEP